MNPWSWPWIENAKGLNIDQGGFLKEKNIKKGIAPLPLQYNWKKPIAKIIWFDCGHIFKLTKWKPIYMRLSLAFMFTFNIDFRSRAVVEIFSRTLNMEFLLFILSFLYNLYSLLFNPYLVTSLVLFYNIFFFVL